MRFHGDFQMRNSLMLTTLVTFFTFSSAAFSAGEKGEKGGMRGRMGPGAMEFALLEKHARDLSINPEQQKKINALKAKTEQAREKTMEDPEIRGLVKEMMQARKDGDEEKIVAARKKMREAVEKKSGLTPEGIQAEIAEILSAAQLARLKKFHEDEGGMAGGEGKGKGKGNKGGPPEKVDEKQKPDVSKGAPKLYELEK